jgi:SET domain-containing protein
MDIIFPSSKIYISQSKISDLGVFARVKIKKGEIFEESPAIVIPNDQLEDLAKTEIVNYIFFDWQKDLNTGAVVLGYGSLFNHSDNNNAEYEILPSEGVIRFTATRDIKTDGEITTNYHGKSRYKGKLWFEVKS